jgi:hypothetical protein
MKIIIVDKIKFSSIMSFAEGWLGISGYYFEHNENLIQRKILIFIACSVNET